MINRSEAREMAKRPIPQAELETLILVSEHARIALWKLRAIWNATPEYLRPRKQRELLELVADIQSGAVALEAPNT